MESFLLGRRLMHELGGYPPRVVVETPSPPSVELTIVVPVYNEQASVPPLVAAVRQALAGRYEWELLLVDDGSTDATAAVAMEESAADERVRLLRLARNYGQTPALQAGFDTARGRIVVSMDGDLQNDPSDIPVLVDKLDEGFDLVAGYRLRRQDKLFSRLIPSWTANRLIRMVTGIPIRDNGCSLKAYRRDLLDRLHLYSDMHRFIPAIAAGAADARIAEIPVRHHARSFGRSKYGLSRILKVSADLLTVLMIRSFRERPLIMFSVWCAAALLLAGASATLAALHSTTVVFGAVSLLFGGLACYLLMLGLIGEVTLRSDWNDEQGLLQLARGKSK